MMQILMSLGFGLVVGVAYALAGIKSPAPPIIALFGLLGMVLGERGITLLKQRFASPVTTASSCTADVEADRARPRRP